jgi:hypothetical protein
MIFKTIIFILIKFVIMYFYDTIKQLLVLKKTLTLFVLVNLVQLVCTYLFIFF